MLYVHFNDHVFRNSVCMPWPQCAGQYLNTAYDYGFITQFLWVWKEQHGHYSSKYCSSLKALHRPGSWETWKWCFRVMSVTTNRLFCQVHELYGYRCMQRVSSFKVIYCRMKHKRCLTMSHCSWFLTCSVSEINDRPTFLSCSVEGVVGSIHYPF